VASLAGSGVDLGAGARLVNGVPRYQEGASIQQLIGKRHYAKRWIDWQSHRTLRPGMAAAGEAARKTARHRLMGQPISRRLRCGWGLGGRRPGPGRLVLELRHRNLRLVQISHDYSDVRPACAYGPHPA
jgi:hypothetical protein